MLIFHQDFEWNRTSIKKNLKKMFPDINPHKTFPILIPNIPLKSIKINPNQLKYSNFSRKSPNMIIIMKSHIKFYYYISKYVIFSHKCTFTILDGHFSTGFFAEGRPQTSKTTWKLFPILFPHKMLPILIPKKIFPILIPIWIPIFPYKILYKIL